MKSKLRIIVSGMVGLYPVGGVAWDYWQYVIGLAAMGHDVYYYEHTWSWPYHPIDKENTDKADYSVFFIKHFFNQYAPKLNEHWHYVHLNNDGYGMSKIKFNEIARTADIFLNVSGASFFPDNLSSKCIKIFLDTDPGYNQIMLSERLNWSRNIDRWCDAVNEHDQHFTYAENIHHQDCLIPKLTFNWKTTRMPVIPDLWKSSGPGHNHSKWTTIMTWNAFKGKLMYKGVEYKSKGGEFEKFLTLPDKTESSFQIAVGGKDSPLNHLTEHGWNVIDGPSATMTPQQYKSFIDSSRGEFSTAKHVYVAMKTGWFSCRSACYLAAGRPVVIQDTGFSSIIPSGNGIIAFNNLTEAIEGLREIEQNYHHHQIAAEELVRKYFQYDIVLNDLLNQI